MGVSKKDIPAGIDLATYVLSQNTAGSIGRAISADEITIGTLGIRQRGLTAQQQGILEHMDWLTERAVGQPDYLIEDIYQPRIQDTNDKLGKNNTAASNHTQQQVSTEAQERLYALRSKRTELGQGAGWRRFIAAASLGLVIFAGLDATILRGDVFTGPHTVRTTSGTIETGNTATGRAALLTTEAALAIGALGGVSATFSDGSRGRRAHRRAARQVRKARRRAS